MSGIEHYGTELAELDHEIRHYAAVCGVDLRDAARVKACLETPHDNWAEDKARQSLQGLLFLRMKVETEMLGEGIVPPPLYDAPPLE
jgi:hypothetical protein